MSYLFTSESVSEGHPDKIADQISDSILDAYLALDPKSKVACETLVTTGLVVLGGEVKSQAKVNEPEVAREVIRNIGYNSADYMFDADSCGIISAIHEQSADIRQGVEQADEEIGAGDQGLMFGYATNETDGYIPLTLDIAHTILKELAVIRKEGKKMKYLRPDAKSQITIEFDEETHVPIKIDTIVVSTQHDPFSTDKQMLKTIREDIVNILIPRVKKKYKKDVQKLFGDNIKYFINPTGRFVIGGPHGDTGLTGRKIIVDTYGGKVSHGGGAFSGKDPTKVDRSAAYATRHMAKNIVAAGVCDEVLVQVAYAIGVAKPVSIYINTMGTSKIYMTDTQITKKLENIFDLSPSAILKRLKLRNPIYSDTAKYGHFGKESFKKNGLEFYTWEKLDHVKVVKNALGIK